MHSSLLFDLMNDPAESSNLIADPKHGQLIATMTASLMSVVDYPKVALSVAQVGPG